MDRKEMAYAIRYMQQVWPRTLVVSAGDDLDDFLTVWLDIIGAFPLGQVLAAVRVVSAEEFPPSPGKLRRAVLDGTGRLTHWDEFARWVRLEASRSSLYTYADHSPFVCPWPELEGVITIEDVQGWARQGLTEHDLETVVIAHVRHRYEAAIARVENALMAGGDGRELPSGGEPRRIGPRTADADD